MEIAELNVAEGTALVSLLQRLVVLDGIITNAERDHVRAVSERFAPDVHRQALIKAGMALGDDEVFVRLVDAVTRPEARTLILEILGRVAAADGVSAKEAELLKLLRGRWGMAG